MPLMVIARTQPTLKAFAKTSMIDDFTVLILLSYFVNSLDHYLRQSNALNLDIDVLGQSLNGNTAAGGLVGKPLFVLGVHGL